MSRSPRQTSTFRALRALWAVVALAIALGGLKSPRLLELTHSHPYRSGTSHFHHDYQDFLQAEKSGAPASGRDTEKHSHRIPTSVDAPVVIGTFSTLTLSLPPAGGVVKASDSQAGPQRPADLLIRPPQAA